MRQPTIKNKHKLVLSDVRRFRLLNKEALHSRPFWRNDVVKAWCLSGSTAKTTEDDMYGTYNDYWIGFFDSGKIEVECSACGGMMAYKFNRFYDPKSIDCELDLEIQEKLLKTLNWLIDSKIVKVVRK